MDTEQRLRTQLTDVDPSARRARRSLDQIYDDLVSDWNLHGGEQGITNVDDTQLNRLYWITILASYMRHPDASSWQHAAYRWNRYMPRIGPYADQGIRWRLDQPYQTLVSTPSDKRAYSMRLTLTRRLLDWPQFTHRWLIKRYLLTN